MLFDGEGLSAMATIDADRAGGAGRASRAAAREPTSVLVTSMGDPETPPVLSIVLAQGISAAEKMDWTIEKAVELGVASIAPLQCARSVVRLDEARAERRMQHWRRLIAAACAQCGRNRIASLHPPSRFEEWIVQSSGSSGADLRIHLDPAAEVSLPTVLSGFPQPAGRLLLACGPEGGFDPGERALLAQHGWKAVRLGPRVLRTETAAMTAVAMIQGWLGDLR